jgi:L-2-hydroxyglutarate oxidase
MGRASTFDIIIIGGGIVGLSTAHRLLQSQPDLKLLLVEKEGRLAMHQSGHNSGVIHSGVYYSPGSLKARLCRAGRQVLLRFCNEEGIPYRISGKVILALNDSETIRLQDLHRRGTANGVHCELIGARRLNELEPHAAGVAALHVLDAGVVDFGEVCNRIAAQVRLLNGELCVDAEVMQISEFDDELQIETSRGGFSSKFLINCAGLFSDRVARLAGARPIVKVIPFRGEYYRLRAEAAHVCRSLIYPVPDPRFPFLGVHLTRSLDGEVHCGPNAVLALAREGYRKHRVNLRDLGEMLSYPGFLYLGARYWRPGVEEMWRSIRKAAFVQALRRLVPAITMDDLIPAPGGVRAQAVTPRGDLLDDFAFMETRRTLHVINAPSPAATAAFAIGSTIAGKWEARLK